MRLLLSTKSSKTMDVLAGEGRAHGTDEDGTEFFTCSSKHIRNDNNNNNDYYYYYYCKHIKVTKTEIRLESEQNRNQTIHVASRQW